MRHVHLIDTSIASDNVGDEIIVEAARRHLDDRLQDAYITTSAGHDGLGHFGRKHAADADVVFFLGTNALSAKYRLSPRYMWAMRRRDLPALAGKVVLLGVGANRDFTEIAPRQRRLLARLLSERFVHSVRDGLAAQIVQGAGRRALNTSCPTLWSYGETTQAPRDKAPRAVFTLTRHRPDDTDAVLLETLLRLYDEVFFWPQQQGDLEHMKTLPGHEKVTVLAPNLQAYDRFLAEAPVDVVGTRLHGTIRGLHHGRRILVISIDNRAREIGRETGLPVIARDEIPAQLADRLAGPIDLKLTIPKDAIDQFLDQFGDAPASSGRPAGMDTGNKRGERWFN